MHGAILAVTALLTAAGVGCKQTVGPPPPVPNFPEYKSQTSPENVVWNLRTAYLRRDIEGYGKFLAPEFRFYFQDADVPQGLGRDYWVHDEDSTHTAILFRTPQVNNISVDLTYEDAVPVTEVGMPAGSMKVHATAHLEVDDVSFTTYIVDADFEDFYFRKGLLQNAGEDTTKWYLFEWYDIRNPGGNGIPAGGPGGTQTAAVQKTTWGMLKTLYR